MMAPDVQHAGTELNWVHEGCSISRPITGLADAGFDRSSGFIIALGGKGAGELHLFKPDGALVEIIAAPEGYRFSHLDRCPDRLLIVGLGEAPLDGWNDWHFEVTRDGALRRLGPAY